MVEKTFDVPSKERFEFVLTVNGNIICQRYFKINNFQEKALGSVHLATALAECKAAIDNDLKEKTNIYLSLTAPQVFKDRAEMEHWLSTHGSTLDVPSYITLRDEDVVFVWNGVETKTYNGVFNRADYVGTQNEAPCVLKLAFLDNGNEVRSISWDGNVYPRFVRTNIDLSNSKNKYEVDGVTIAPYEAFIVNQFNVNRGDLIPFIMRKISFACNNEKAHYYSRVKYGSKEYDFNLQGYNERLFFGMKNKVSE